MINAGNTVWVLISGMLVLLMTPGLAFFYAGLGPRRNAVNTLSMCFICLVTIPIIWALFGYSFVFAPFKPWIGGIHYFALAHSLQLSQPGDIPEFARAFYEICFAVISAAIIAGAVAGRMRFKAYVLFTCCWSIFVYIPIAHWIWGPDGWLAHVGVLDYAGGLVVHISAGFSALSCAAILGPRKSEFGESYEAHHIPFVILGASLLWFGWFGFNGGSSFAVDMIAALSVINTLLATATAGFTWILLAWLRDARTPAIGVCTAIVVGLVAITPAAGFVSTAAAMLIGVVASFLTFYAFRLKAKFMHIDDTKDAFICHGIAGVIGSVLTAIFASHALNPLASDGVSYGNWRLLGIELFAILIVVIYALVGSALILGLIKLIMPLRVNEIAEYHSIDLAEHGEHAYRD